MEDPELRCIEDIEVHHPNYSQLQLGFSSGDVIVTKAKFDVGYFPIMWLTGSQRHQVHSHILHAIAHKSLRRIRESEIHLEMN